MKILEDKLFKDLTTFHIGGKIQYYAEVKDKKEIEEVISFAKSNSLNIFIIGGGSDFLVSDKPFKGLVIKFVGTKVKISGDSITAEGGTNWDELVGFSVRNNLQGIECLSGIPGTVGAAPIQNIGAYGAELKDVFEKLAAYDIDKEKFVEFDRDDCKFGYRESLFKEKSNWQKYIIVNITLKLHKAGKPFVSYESLNGRVKENPTLLDVRNAILEVRKERLEDPAKVGNAGSFFKNPVVGPAQKNKLENDFPGIKIFPFDDRFKVSAAWLIEKAGWKGKTNKDVGVSSKHALILVNRSGKAKAEDILELSGKIIKSVREKFGLTLEPEVQLIGFDKKVAILGYGIEGQDAGKYFKKLGDEITILDKKFDENYLSNLSKFDVIVRSPGVYRFLPEIVKAEKDGVEITSAIKIFFDKCLGKVIGVTGTKGKGTTSTLIYEILKKAGKDVYLVGNIGKPYLELLPRLTKDSFVVMEVSSFQLVDLTKSPHIAIVLNITEDHLDWHKDREEYVNAKKNIVRYQLTADWAVINEEYETPKSFAKETIAHVVYFSKKSLDEKFKENLLLRGEHNLENIAASVLVAQIIKIDENVILDTVRSFKGLEHRLELVGTIKGVTFYNDSFATGPQPTIAAINSFTEPETLILGGSDKGLDYQELGKIISVKENVKNIILIGETKFKIRTSLQIANRDLSIVGLDKTNMKEIVEIAYKITEPGGVVILSPASASFDMFENYKDRGNQFKKAVHQINEKEN